MYAKNFMAVIPFGMVALLASPALALPTTSYTFESELVCSDTPPVCDAAAAEANSELPQFPNGVDFIGKWDFDDDAFDSEFVDGDEVIIDLDGTTGSLLGGDLPFFSDEAMSVELIDPDGQVSGDSFWKWTLLERTDIWDIVKIGVKQGNADKTYFLVDPPADMGDFTMAELAGLIGGGFAFNGQGENDGAGEFSHVSFFGTTTAQNLPEPTVLGLLGLGLVGLGLARRRRT